MTSVKIIPKFNAHYHLPTIYDNVIINDGNAILSYNSVDDESFSVIISPDSSNITYKKRASDLNAILKKTYNDTKNYIALSSNPSLNDDLIETLSVDLKSLLENYKSILDYVAHYIAQRCTPIPKEQDIYFPIAKKSKSEIDFRNSLAKTFPNLETNCKAAFDYILQIQHFNDDIVLLELNELVNRVKHRELTILELQEHEAVLVKCDNVGFRLGELGFDKIELGEKGQITLKGSSKEAIIKGKKTLTSKNYSQLSQIQNIEIQIEKFFLLTPKGYSKSISGIVWSLSSNLFRHVNEICAALKN